MMRNTLLYIYIGIMTICFALKAHAQGEAMDANVSVSFINTVDKKVSYRTVQYALFKTTNKANIVRAVLEDAVVRQRGSETVMMEMDAWDKAVERQKVKFRTSRGNGSFRVHAYPDMAILVCTYNPDDELTIEDARFEVITLREGETDYSAQFRYGMGNTQTIDETIVIGENKDTLTMEPPVVWDDGKYLSFNIRFELPAGYGSEEGRLIVQPVAVECQTEDTVEYINGLVMEGEKYHRVQNRMMAFDYMKNDKVAYAYIPQKMWSDEKIVVNKNMVYLKPDPKKTYKIPYSVKIADMNHVYFTREAATGSCNAKRIFKFLDLGVSAADMDIQEFKIEAESNYSTKNQDLRLKFEVGRSVLTTDSTNQVQLKNLVEELRSYGDQLMEVRIEATASPEGGVEKNRLLAQERTRMAANRVKSYLGKMDVAYHIATPRVFTWGEVADQIKENGNEGLAERIRQSMGSDGYGGDAVIMNLPEYDEEVAPVLENLRMMRVTYRYEREHIMDENEVLHEYYKRRSALLKGNGKDFSDGDYYNLFNVIRDSLERDTLTMIAYKHVTRHPGYEQEKFSMYVANRMASLNQRRGTPDANVLRPFINQRLGTVATRENNNNAQQNRREVLINQIITYFQMEERDTALNYMHFWFDNSKRQDNDPKVQRLKQFIAFKEGFFRNVSGQLSGEDKKEFDEAMEYVYSAAKDNKAIIYAEAYDIMGISQAEADSLVNNMDNDDARKWYLKGILAAKKEETQANTRGKSYVPDYLAYFHQSFLMQPSYKLLYFNEGQVSDQLREKYRYRKSDYKKYEDRLKQLVRVKVSSKRYLNDSDIEISGEDDDQEIALTPAFGADAEGMKEGGER